MDIYSVSNSNLASLTLLANVNKRFEAQREQTTQLITGHYNSRINAVDLEAAKWRKVRDGVEDAAEDLMRGVVRLQRIRKAIDNLMVTVGKVTQDAEGFATYAQVFDSQIKSLRRESDDGSTTPNLLGGSLSINNLTYRSNINGAMETVYGADAGADYYIIDSNGDRWGRDWEQGHLIKYDGYPSTLEGDVYAVPDSVELDSYVDGAVDFTIGGETAGASAHSGTLTTEGLGIIDSWLYGQFETAADRTRALDDLQVAKDKLDMQISRMVTAKNTADFFHARAKVAIEAHKNKTGDYIDDMQGELTAALDELTQQHHTATLFLRSAQSIKNEYARMFESLRTDNKINNLFDILL